MFTTEFGNKVREIRKQQGIRQGDLASKLNITQASISQIEKGERVPPPALVRRFADALEVSANAFYSEETEFERAILQRNVENLSQESLRKINEYIESLTSSN